MRDSSNSELIDNLVDKVSALFGSIDGGGHLGEEVRHNLRAVIHSAVSKLDMVSREEFDAQVAVLSRSREKIDALERQLTELTEQLNEHSTDANE